MGYAAAFRLTALAFAALSAAALFHLPEETRHLAVRHHRTDVRVLSCIIVASLLAGLSTGLYGPQVLPFLHDRFSLSPFAAVLAYLPAAISWFVGPRLARPARSSVALGSLVVAVALIGMETTVPDVYAAGDVAEKVHRITGRRVWIPLAPTANKEGQVAGGNAVKGRVLKFPGVVGTAVTKFYDLYIARTGLGEKEAAQLGFKVQSSLIKARTKAHYMATLIRQIGRGRAASLPTS